MIYTSSAIAQNRQELIQVEDTTFKQKWIHKTIMIMLIITVAANFIHYLLYEHYIVCTSLFLYAPVPFYSIYCELPFETSLFFFSL